MIEFIAWIATIAISMFVGFWIAAWLMVGDVVREEVQLHRRRRTR